MLTILKCLTKSKLSDILESILDSMHKKNEISGSQKKMISLILKLSQIKVRDVMVPRANMHTIHIEDSDQSILNTIKTARHSRYPVTTTNKDDIVGILLAKNMLMKENEQTLPDLCIEPFFVPESKRLDSLLIEFQKNHTHMAIVKDEYNGVAGLITLEDVIEEILGEIEDEDFSGTEKLTIKAIAERKYLIAGTMTLTEVNNVTGTNFQSESVDTLGGYVAQHLGYFPKSKIKFEHKGIIFKIEHADAKNIKSIKITLPKQTEQ